MRGVGSIVEACDILNSDDCIVELLMFGEGDIFNQLQSQSKSREWMQVIGKVSSDEVPELLVGCEIGIIPFPDLEIWNHSSPLKLFEFAASGLSVIATDIVCNQVVGDREWLYLYDPKSGPGGLSRKIRSLLEEGDLLSKSAKNKLSKSGSVFINKNNS